MIIDGRSITPSQAKPVNEALNAAWNNVHHLTTESREVFLELCDGSPDSIEILVGGETLHVHDRRSPTPVYLEECITDAYGLVVGRRNTDLACGNAFRVAAGLSPIDRIKMTDDQWLIITALKCAAANSEDYGHSEQAAQYRRLWTQLEY